MFVSLTQVFIVFIAKKVTSIRVRLGQVMGVARNRMPAWALQTSRKKAVCSFTKKLDLITVLGKYIAKILQEPLKSKKSR